MPERPEGSRRRDFARVQQRLEALNLAAAQGATEEPTRTCRTGGRGLSLAPGERSRADSTPRRACCETPPTQRDPKVWEKHLPAPAGQTWSTRSAPRAAR